MRGTTDGKKTDGYGKVIKPTMRKPARGSTRAIPYTTEQLLQAVANGATHVRQRKSGAVDMIVYNRTEDK